MSSMSEQRVAHRMRCITIKIGVVNICPNCGYQWVTDFEWDFRRDPCPELGVIHINSDEDARRFVQVMQDIAPTVAVPCIPDCESRDSNP